MIAHPVDLDITGYQPEHSFARASVVHYDLIHRLARGLKLSALVWFVAIPLFT
jgi:hypothetical protein